MLEFGIVDAHVHLIDRSRFKYDWTEGLAPLEGDFALDDLIRQAKPYRIEGVVFVEVDADKPREEAEWVDGIAVADPRLKGAVVSLDLERGAAAEEDVARLAALESTRGVRRLLQGEADPDFALRPDFLAGLKLLPKYGLSFDVCVRAPQLPMALEMARRCEDVSFILDHIGKPDIKAGPAAPWKDAISELARLPNVAVKLSGLTTEADPLEWTPAQLKPFIDWTCERFGIERILYASDWPVCRFAGDYLQWLVTLEQAVDDFTEGEKRNLFADNARRVYRL
jgi:L-fuconolactonase